MSTLKEPYRVEGKKTMGYEVAEQFGWELPDVIVYPAGGGTGLVGMWKAFEELERIGWVKGRKPRMVCVQAEGCAPIVKAFEGGKDDRPDRLIERGNKVPRHAGNPVKIRPRVLREACLVWGHGAEHGDFGYAGPQVIVNVPGNPQAFLFKLALVLQALDRAAQLV